MAENPHLTIKLNGNPVNGDSTQKTKDGSIELTSFSWGVSTPIDHGTGAPTGRRVYQPITITKRVDKASPLLMNGLVTNQICEGSIKFYRPTKKGDASSENFYTCDFGQGRIESISASIGGNGEVPHESLTIVFTKITWTYDTDGAKGITATDKWEQS